MDALCSQDIRVKNVLDFDAYKPVDRCRQPISRDFVHIEQTKRNRDNTRCAAYTLNPKFNMN